MQKSYSISKFPPKVSKLFEPRPPLKHIQTTRRTKPIEIDGISNVINLIDSYKKEFPPNPNDNSLSYQDEITSKQSIYALNLEIQLKKWNPQEDENLRDSDPFCTIFVARLPYEIDEIELQKQFVKFGEIEKIRIVRDKITNKSRGYGFIVFKDSESSKKVCREIGVHRGTKINGRPVIVDIERGRTIKYFKPRRLGGGLGGRGYMRRDKMNQLFKKDDMKKSKPNTTRLQSHSNINPRTRYCNNTSSTLPNHSIIKPPLSVNNITSYRSRRSRSSNNNNSHINIDINY